MAIDFSLANQGAMTPMAASNPMGLQGFDPVGSTKAAYDIAGKSLENRENERAQKEADTDREFLNEAMKSGKYDVSSPEGLSKLAQDYGPRVSPNTNFNLAKLVTAAKEKDIMFRQHLATKKVQDLKVLSESEDQVMPFIGKIIQKYETTKAAKGEQFANEEFQNDRNQLVQQLGGMKLPDGSPRIQPEVFQKLNMMDPQQLKEYHGGSDYRKGLLANAMTEAHADEYKARTDALNNPKDWQQYKNPDTGEIFFWNKKAGRTQAVDQNTGQRYDVSNLPPNAVAVSGIRPVSEQSPLGRLLADREKLKINGKWTPEAEKLFSSAMDKLTGSSAGFSELDDDQKAWATEFTANGGKFPNYPIGQGSAGVAFKKEMLKNFVIQGMASGFDGSDVAIKQAEQRAASEALKKMITQNAIVVTTEGTVDKAITNVEEELKKIGGIGSPLIRKYMNMAMTDVVGSDKWVALNQYMTEVVEGMSRVYANQTGAGSTPIGFLELAKKSINPNQTLSQWLESSKAMRKLMTNRAESVTDTIQKVKEQGRSQVKARPDLLRPTGAPAPASGEPEKPTSMDDAAKDYINNILPQVTNLQLKPEERKAMYDRALRRYNELRSMKITVPEPKLPSPTGAAASAPAAKSDFSHLWR